MGRPELTDLLRQLTNQPLQLGNLARLGFDGLLTGRTIINRGNLLPKTIYRLYDVTLIIDETTNTRAIGTAYDAA